MKLGMNKKIKYSHTLIAFFMLSVLWLLSCQDDEIETITPSVEGELIELDESCISVSSKKQYKTIKVIAKKDGIAISADCDADWIELQADTVAYDGYLEFLVYEDEKEVERNAIININATDGKISETLKCEITQSEDNGSNYEESATKTMRVGYGYNIFGAFQNDVSVMAPIISQNYIDKVNSMYNLVETNPRNSLNTEIIVARSLQEMATLLTEKEEKTKSGISGGASKTVNIHSTSSYSAGEEQYSYIRLLKSVAMRSMDLAVVNMLIEKGEKVFSSEFENTRNAVIKAPTEKNINDMIDKFGTHMVVQAELGASIELSINFSRNIKGSLEMRTEDFSDYFFHNESSSFLLPNNKIEGMINNISIDKTCIITGGGSNEKKNLENDINKNGRVSQQVLKAWLDSSSGDITSDATANALAPVNFMLIPIWYLFPKECLGDIARIVNERGDRSNTQISDSKIGTDYYKIELTDNILSFGNNSEDTQVKVMYVQNSGSMNLEPVLEICNEYVPNIRGDKRIPVVYGIRNGSPFIGAGFFPGDGQNPPAWLTFSEGKVYVKPVEGADASKQIRTIYYLHGNIYDTDYGIEVQKPRTSRVVDQYLEFELNYPIVKIGEGYWTRKNIQERMFFGESNNPSNIHSPFEVREVFNKEKNMLYACIFYGNSPDFTSYHKDFYGQDTDDIYGERTKWYLPKKENIYNLKSYVGNNPRILLKKQVSGFDAQFEGVFGIWDDITGKMFEYFSYHYEGEYCFIPCKDDNNHSNGEALILSKDYKLSISGIEKTRQNNYPIRLYRTAYWKYTNIH